MSSSRTIRVVDVRVLDDHIVRTVGIPTIGVCNLDSIEALSNLLVPAHRGFILTYRCSDIQVADQDVGAVGDNVEPLIKISATACRPLEGRNTLGEFFIRRFVMEAPWAPSKVNRIGRRS